MRSPDLKSSCCHMKTKHAGSVWQHPGQMIVTAAHLEEFKEVRKMQPFQDSEEKKNLSLALKSVSTRSRSFINLHILRCFYIVLTHSKLKHTDC